ncbi:low molecular weight phosphatase family protein [Serinicoccus chungangensis]|uniref:arsenate-mycothiol transferase ArsC n=1 Tax=Serinicoccus chungangensis TaxID=767452 RepID=UPI003AF32499
MEQEARIDEFLTVFVQRRAEELLAEQARERGIDLAHVTQVLFVDDANTGRSHVAAVIANGRGEGLIRARSGGVVPGEQIRPEIQELLRDRGFDPDEFTVTPMTGKLVLTSDVVVTMGLSDEEKVQMPTHGLHQVDWDDLTSLEGRSDLDVAFGEIEARVSELVDALLEKEKDLAEREADPEVEEELRRVIGELHDPERG